VSNRLIVPQHNPRKRQIRVLCVDDDAYVLDGLCRTLHGKCDVCTALGAEAAIRLINAGPSFDVVISDLQMPGMDGLTFLRWVAANAPDTCGILLTGNANLANAIAAANAGHIFRFLTKPCPPDELLQAITRGEERYSAKRAERLLLSQAVDQDVLTGLPDRRRIAADVARLRENDPGASLTLFVIAIDELDLVRRTLGHVAADRLFVAAVQRLQMAIGDPRCPLPGAILFRIDERLVLLWCEHQSMSAEMVAEHLLRTMQTEVVIAGQNLRLAGHAGIAGIIADPAGSPNTQASLMALRNAEAACLEAIALGTSRIAHYSASANVREQRRLQLLQRLRQPRFITDLSCVYQPQWNLTHNCLSGLEALARWRDPDLGVISPGEFVPLAEEDLELAARFGEAVLLMACEQRQAWRALIPDNVRVSVNVSATELRSDDLHEKVMRCLAKTGLPAALLEVEITESAAVADFDKSNAQLRELRRNGISIAIDDFGVGFSSLSYLAALPATSLKIDRSFIDAGNTSSRRADLLRGICELGHAMRMQVVVEGAESFDSVLWLRSIGCDVVQGYAIARPLAASAFADWYEGTSASIVAALNDDVGAGRRRDLCRSLERPIMRSATY
jgi:diguanylate cyclase